MATLLSNSQATFTFVDDATTGFKLYSFQRAGTSQIWLNSDTQLWRATVFDTTAASPFTPTALTPTAGTFSSSGVSTDSQGQQLTTTWTAVPVGSGDKITVAIIFRLNNDEDNLRASISAAWVGTPTKFALHELCCLPIKTDALNRGNDFAVLPSVLGILSQDPVTHLKAGDGVSAGWNLQSINRWSYPSGRGWGMGFWGYYETPTNEGWMYYVEDWSLEVFHLTYGSDGTRLFIEAFQPQKENIFIGNAGAALGSGYSFCLRPLRITQQHGWWDIARHYKSRVETLQPDFYLPIRTEREDLSDTEKAYSVFIDMSFSDSTHTPGDGKPGNLTALLDSIRNNCGAPAGTPLWGIIEADTYNLRNVGETADGDLQAKMLALYNQGNNYFGLWDPATGSGVLGEARSITHGPPWPIAKWDKSVGDSAELRWMTSNDVLGSYRMSRKGKLEGGGDDRLSGDSAQYYRERTYPITGWNSGTFVLSVTGNPSTDGFLGTNLDAVVIPASSSARLLRARVSSLGSSSITMVAAFTDSLGNVVAPTSSDTVVLFTYFGPPPSLCFHAVVNADAYLTRLKNNTTVGVVADWGACGFYMDTYAEPALKFADSDNRFSFCYRDHATWSKINPGYVQHPHGAGDWHKIALRDFIGDLRDAATQRQSNNGRDPFFSMTCEDMEETLHGKFDWGWHVISSGSVWRDVASTAPTVHQYKTIPLYAVVYAGRTMGRAFLQEFSSATLTNSSPYNDPALHAFLAYAMASEWPYGITFPTLSLYEDSSVTLKDFFDDTLYISGGGTVSNTVKAIRDLWVQIVTAESRWILKYLRYGQMMAPPTVDFGITTTTTGLSKSTYSIIFWSYDTIYERATFPRVTSAVWKATDGQVCVVLVNWTDTAADWAGVVDIDGAGLGSPGSLSAMRVHATRLNASGVESGTALFDPITGRVEVRSIAAFTVAAVTLIQGGGMVNIVKGSTFNTTATAGGMHALIEQATITNIDRGSMRGSEATVATFSPTAPPMPADRELWQASPSNALLSYDSANAVFRGTIPQYRVFTLDSASPAANAGDALIATGTSTLAELKLFKGQPGVVVGIALHPTAPGAKGVCITSGPAKSNTTGTITSGQAVKLSTTAGLLQSAGSIGSGFGSTVMGTCIVDASGGSAWINLRR